MGKKNKNKPNNFLNSLALKKNLLLKKAEDFLIKEIKEEHFDNFLISIRNKFKLEGFLTEEMKLFLVGFFIVCSAIWIENNGIIQVVHSEDLKIANAQAIEKIEAPVLEEGENKKIDAKALNEYKLIPPETKCEEDKGQRKSSDLCGKDDEEELKKIEKERKEKVARAIASQKPRIVKVSCREEDLGDPSKSDTKGKHVDEDCCPDPDEWPKPGCVYNAEGYAIMLKGPRK